MSNQQGKSHAAAQVISTPLPAMAKTRGWWRLRGWLGPAVWCLGLLVPVLLSASWITIGGMFAIYAIAALSQDIVLGRAGMYDMGHAVYLGIGAYTTAILSLSWGWPVLWTIPIAVIIAVIIAGLLAAPIVKLRGDYLLVVTIGFNSIFVLALKNNLFGLTGGADGLFGIEPPSLFGHVFWSQTAMFYIDWAVFGRRGLVDAQSGSLCTGTYLSLHQAG